MLRLRTETEASVELAETALWYERQRNGIGVEFINAIDAALDFIARFPEAGSPVRHVPKDLAARRVPVRRFPFHVASLLNPEKFMRLANSYEDFPVKKTKSGPALKKTNNTQISEQKMTASISLPAFGFAVGLQRVYCGYSYSGDSDESLYQGESAAFRRSLFKRILRETRRNHTEVAGVSVGIRILSAGDAPNWAWNEFQAQNVASPRLAKNARLGRLIRQCR